jgi:hypothetical protein
MSVYIASNDELLIGRDVEGSGCGQILSVVRVFTWGGCEKLEDT